MPMHPGMVVSGGVQGMGGMVGLSGNGSTAGIAGAAGQVGNVGMAGQAGIVGDGGMSMLPSNSGGSVSGFAAGRSNSQMKPGDWLCPGCSDLQFARNMQCRRCQTPNPNLAGGGPKGAPVLPGD